MPDVTITIGGKEFTVACQEGEEAFLASAAQLLDQEASALIEQIGKLPESRMLLMAGLMLADRTAAFEERARMAEARLTSDAEAPEASRLTTLVALADRAEALAERAERVAAAR